MRNAALLLLLATSLLGDKFSLSPVPRRAIALSAGEIKLSDVYDKNTGTYYEPVYADQSAYDIKELKEPPTGKGVTVAFLDTGVLHQHPLIKRAKIVDADFTGNGAEDDNGHGTTMLLLYLSTTTFTDQTILNIRVLGRDGTGTPDQIEKGMRWAVDHGAQILNMSLGVPQVVAQDLCDFADKLATERNVLIVAAAGNDPGLTMCPAAAKNVLSTGAVGLKPPMQPVIYAPGTISFRPVSAKTGGSGAVGSSFIDSYVSAYERSDFDSTHSIAKSNMPEAKQAISALLSDSRRAYQAGDCTTSLSDAALMYRMSTDIRDLEHVGVALNELGVGFRCAGDRVNAMVAYRGAITVHKAAKDRAGEEVTLSNLGELQEEMGLHSEAEATLNESLRIAQDPTVNDSDGEIAILGNLCTVNHSLGEDGKALAFCLKALERARSLGNHFYEGRNLLNLGTIYKKQGELLKAKQYLTQAVESCSKSGDQEGLEIANSQLKGLHR